ncbi:hypothetical protein V1477_007197 [Vespula maculifrons]|uniref:Uncharacterized protein n=1 Tax=Vespula maculifrons TaxID=7453 RepID=A0ABD2CIR8_VESMC
MRLDLAAAVNDTGHSPAPFLGHSMAFRDRRGGKTRTNERRSQGSQPAELASESNRGVCLANDAERRDALLSSTRKERKNFDLWTTFYGLPCYGPIVLRMSEGQGARWGVPAPCCEPNNYVTPWNTPRAQQETEPEVHILIYNPISERSNIFEGPKDRQKTRTTIRIVWIKVDILKDPSPYHHPQHTPVLNACTHCTVIHVRA